MWGYRLRDNLIVGDENSIQLMYRHQQVAAQQAQHGLVGPLPALLAPAHAQGPEQLLMAHLRGQRGPACKRSGDAHGSGQRPV